jgi:hypothetical protein
MNHRLLVAREEIAKVLVLMERLAYSRYISMTEDAPRASEKLLFLSIAFDVLPFKKRDQRLRHR